jgi:hypothetical protein
VREDGQRCSSSAQDRHKTATNLLIAPHQPSVDVGLVAQLAARLSPDLPGPKRVSSLRRWNVSLSGTYDATVIEHGMYEGGGEARKPEGGSAEVKGQPVRRPSKAVGYD